MSSKPYTMGLIRKLLGPRKRKKIMNTKIATTQNPSDYNFEFGLTKIDLNEGKGALFTSIRPLASLEVTDGQDFLFQPLGSLEVIS